MTDAQVIEQWNNEFRDEVRKLRVNLAEYTGIFGRVLMTEWRF